MLPVPTSNNSVARPSDRVKGLRSQDTQPVRPMSDVTSEAASNKRVTGIDAVAKIPAIVVCWWSAAGRCTTSADRNLATGAPAICRFRLGTAIRCIPHAMLRPLPRGVADKCPGVTTVNQTYQPPFHRRQIFIATKLIELVFGVLSCAIPLITEETLRDIKCCRGEQRYKPRCTGAREVSCSSLTHPAGYQAVGLVLPDRRSRARTTFGGDRSGVRVSVSTRKDRHIGRVPLHLDLEASDAYDAHDGRPADSALSGCTS